jgi:quinoprotein dehydrogenase-associated probable ABC transporter substrate-binding protein
MGAVLAPAIMFGQGVGTPAGGGPAGATAAPPGAGAPPGTPPGAAEPGSAGGQGGGVGQGALELVDPKVLRVCSDPNNLPFSNTKGEGFENKLAELFAAKLGKRLAYTYYPQATGFVRVTLGSYRCDVIMGFPQGDDLVQGTNPYYRTGYALVTKASSPLAAVDALDDQRLKDKRIGVVAGTPPASYFVTDGLMAKAKPYPLVVDTRFDSSPAAMIKDIESGTIDAGVLWGPIAGYYASHANPPMHMVLLLKDTGGPHMIFRITMGVRYSDQNWKRQLNGLIAANQPAINKLLIDYGVPILDEDNKLITADALTQRP